MRYDSAVRRVAVMLNRSAQGVTARRLRWFAAHVPADDLFVTQGDSRAAVAQIVRRGYDVVCAGGGDGTFMRIAGELLALAPAQLPALMPLRLGTGNAIHDVARASPPTRRGLARDLAHAADPRARIAPIRLLDVDGVLTQFAGVGLDADWADDYARLIKRRVGHGPLLPLVRGVPGYALTAITRTIPRLLRRPFVAVRVTAPDGARDLATGRRIVGALFDGPATMVSASTVGSYSAGFRYFQHAEALGDAFEVKIARATPARVLRHARRVLAGAASDLVLDFATAHLRVELATPAPYHVGGDVLPPVAAFTIRLGPQVPVLRPDAR
jgi:diacylglycerol kinase family enzyme